MRFHRRVLRTDFFRMETESSRIDETVVTNDHIQQQGPRFLAGNSIGLAGHKLAAMLTLIVHGFFMSKQYATQKVACDLPKCLRHRYLLRVRARAGKSPPNLLTGLTDKPDRHCAKLLTVSQRLQPLHINLSQVLESIACIENQRAVFGNHGVVEGRMIGQNRDQIRRLQSLRRQVH